MIRTKALTVFVAVTAMIVVFGYTRVEAAECVTLQGFKICAADPFYQVGEANVSFNYTAERTSSGSEILSFIDILIPGSIDPGCGERCLLENWNCPNIETWFDGVKVANVVYDLKQGTPISRFGAGISDKRALRAVIGKKFTGVKSFSVKIKNQAKSPITGPAYLQVTKPVNRYDSAKLLGPEDGTAAPNFGQAVYEEVPIAGGAVSYLIDHLQQKIYDSRDPGTPLEGKLIGSMRIKFKAGEGVAFTEWLPVKNITNKALFDGGEGSCYPYVYNNRYYNICYP